jgi:molybdopterin-guanine dinucleotide biosynthesis protein A
MGRDKAHLGWRGTTLAGHAAEQLGPFCHVVVLVGGRGGPSVPGFPVLADRRSGEGPLAGLETALAAAAGAPVLLLACDLPAVDRELLEDLMRAAGDFGCAGPEARVAAAAGRAQPLCALYSASCAPLVSAALDRGERAARSLLEGVRVTPVEAGERLVNVNTPEEWERWLTAGGRASVPS